MAGPPKDGSKSKAPLAAEKKSSPEPSAASFTANDVLQGFVDPHRPEARVSAPERKPKPVAADSPPIESFTASDVLAGTRDPHAATSAPAPTKPKKKELILPELDDGEPRPPPFLSPFQAMKDVYFKVKGRASRRTQELLESADLEDLVNELFALAENQQLARKSEGRLAAPIQKLLGSEPGPLLTGFGDPRLAELWRLFLEGWDIWVPEKGEGLELFWEGETEDESGEPIEILWVLRKRAGEIELQAKLGQQVDAITFDGTSFFRLRNQV